MIKYIKFTPEVWEDYEYWQDENDKIKIKKIRKFIKEIKRTPYTGIGSPEPLKYSLSGLWSREIDEKHRLVYFIDNDSLIIHQCKGHYSDK